MRRLQAEGVADGDDVTRVRERSQALEGLLEELTAAANDNPLACHPVTLGRWYAILRGNFVPGDPAVEVRVITTHVL